MGSTISKGSFTLVQIPQWTVAFLQRDVKFSISTLMQSTVESADLRGKCEWGLILFFFFAVICAQSFYRTRLNIISQAGWYGCLSQSSAMLHGFILFRNLLSIGFLKQRPPLLRSGLSITKLSLRTIAKEIRSDRVCIAEKCSLEERVLIRYFGFGSRCQTCKRSGGWIYYLWRDTTEIVHNHTLNRCRKMTRKNARKYKTMMESKWLFE